MGLAGLIALCLHFSCQNPSTPQKFIMVYKNDGKPTYQQPQGNDRKFIPSHYDQLKPSRKDGKPTFSSDFFSGRDKTWQKILATFKNKPNLRYLEVGVFEGRSFLWIFQNILNHPSTTGVGIDVFLHKGLEERFRENLHRAGIEKRVTVFKGYSNILLRSLELNSFDLIYVDGSHTAGDVLRDAILSWDLLKVGGILIFDDYLYTPHFPSDLKPVVALNAFVTSFREEVQVLHRGWELIIKKQKAACPGTCSTLGPYHYYWYWDEKRDRSGDLYDPRTKTRVPLTADERKLVEFLLRSRPFGWTETVVEADVITSEKLKKLREKLGI
jgi:predicted O-methyltransferase YrrM